MNKFSMAISASILALAVAAGTPAAAVTFVDFSKKPGSGATNVRWVKNGVGTGGRFYTGGSSAASATAVPVIFNFQDPALLVGLGLYGLQANFLLNGTAVATPAITTPDGWVQSGVTGTFSFTLNQALTPGQISGSGCLNTCTNLLSGTFANGSIKGLGNAGSFTTADFGIQAISFTSDFLDFTGLQENMTLTLGSIVGSPSIGHLPGKALNNFKASVTGSFGGQPVAYVPEPATWAMMIVGLGGAGAMLRRRRQLMPA